MITLNTHRTEIKTIYVNGVTLTVYRDTDGLNLRYIARLNNSDILAYYPGEKTFKISGNGLYLFDMEFIRKVALRLEATSKQNVYY
jgi:hypothetical protein